MSEKHPSGEVNHENTLRDTQDEDQQNTDREIRDKGLPEDLTYEPNVAGIRVDPPPEANDEDLRQDGESQNIGDQVTKTIDNTQGVNPSEEHKKNQTTVNAVNDVENTKAGTEAETTEVVEIENMTQIEIEEAPNTVSETQTNATEMQHAETGETSIDTEKARILETDNTSKAVDTPTEHENLIIDSQCVGNLAHEVEEQPTVTEEQLADLQKLPEVMHTYTDELSNTMEHKSHNGRILVTDELKTDILSEVNSAIRKETAVHEVTPVRESKQLQKKSSLCTIL